MAGAITLFFLSLLFFCSHALVSPGSSNATAADELALLSFKSMLSSGPSEGLLASWNMSSHFCSWPGVACGRRHFERVVSLRMGSFNLSGRISPFLGNLSFLKELDLGNNHLTGEIPPELGHLGRLQVLNLSTNNLQGSIPVAMGGCAKLTTIDLGNNQLQEYGAGNMVSMHGDVYSYGILVLETITGKRPTDSKFTQGLSLREYVDLGLHDRMMDVVDMQLYLDLENGLQTANDSSYRRKIDCVASVLRLGMSCSQELPSSRMPTGDIIKELHVLKESLSKEYRT